VSLFRNPAFSAAAVALGLNFFALQGATFYLVYYLQGALGYSPLQSGAALIPVALGMAVMGPRSSTLADQFGAKAVCGTGFLLIALSFAGFQLLDQHAPVWLLLGILTVQGVGMGSVMAPATESIMSVVPREKAGAGAAVNNSVRQVGGALGVAILGSLLSSGYRSEVEAATTALPAPAGDAANDTLGGALQVASQLGGSAGRALTDASQHAFVSGMGTAALVAAAVTLAGSLAALVLLPSREAPVVELAAGELQLEALAA
jgi:Na+/melibiose symporter-like transporter